MNKLPPPFILKLVSWLWNGLHSLASRLIPPETRLLLLGAGVMKTVSINTAARLKIADCLADGSQSLEALAKATDTHPDSLYRLLRALTSEGIFRELPGRRFETTPMGRALETNSANSLWLGAMLFGDKTWVDSWMALPHSIQTGETAFEHVFGQRYFDYLTAHPAAGTHFNGWMAQFAEMHSPIIRAVFAAEPAGKVVDVGGGQGMLLNTALASNPRLTGTLFDMPEVVANAALDEAIAERCEIVGGSFFETVPKGGDIYVLRQIIHDWGDAECYEILRRCHEAMDAGSRLFIFDSVLEDINKPDFNKFMDLHMLVLNHGGRERTEAEFRDLLSRAGFAVTRMVPTPSPFYLIEASKHLM